MAADITDKFSKIISGTTRPVATTLSAQKLIGATTASLTAATGWDTDTAVHGIMYRTDAGTGAKVAGSQIDWKATLSGTTLSNFTVTAGTDDTYAIGATVELAPTAAWGDDMATGILVEHNQDGTHGAVTATSVSAPTVAGTTSVSDAGQTLQTYRSEFLFDHVNSGCVWSGDAYGSTRNASMTAGVVYIGGKRVTVALVTARAFTASKDTYIDVDNTGTLVYTEVANNAASPALAANSVRIGIIVTGASNIAAVGSVNQGQEDKVLPIASSIPYQVTDSLGNLICPRDPNRKVLGYRQIISNFSSGTTAETLVTGLNTPIIVPTGRKIKVTFLTPSISGVTGIGTVRIYNGVFGGGGTQIQQANEQQGNGFTATTYIGTPSTASNTFTVSVASTAGNPIVSGVSTSPSYVLAELA